MSLGWWTSLPPWTKAPSLSAPSPASSPRWRIEGNPTRPPGEMLGTPGKLGNFHESHESAHPGARPNATRFYTKTGTGADKASLSTHVPLQAGARPRTAAGRAHSPPGQARNPAAGPRPRSSLCVDPPAPNILRSRAWLHLSFIRVSVQCHLLQKPFPTLTLRPPPPRQPLCHLPRPSGSWNRLVRFIFRVCVWLPLLGGQRSDFSQAHGLFAPQPYLFPTLRPQARDLTSLGLTFSPVKWA